MKKGKGASENPLKKVNQLVGQKGNLSGQTPGRLVWPGKKRILRLKKDMQMPPQATVDKVANETHKNREKRSPEKAESCESAAHKRLTTPARMRWQGPFYFFIFGLT